MKIIEINVNKKIASLPVEEFIICGNNDYKIKFNFDADWTEHENKVARFIFNEKYIEKNFSGDTCEGVIITNTREVFIGVYANGETLATTTPARIACKKSVLCDDIAGTKTKEVIITKGDKGESAYEIAVKNGYEGTEKEWLESLTAANPEIVKEAVTEYLDENPIEAPVTSVNGKTGDVELTAEDVGAISTEELETAVDEALKKAKESGEFDGKDGQDGADGKDGKDGFSPIVEVTETTNGHSVKITDADGEHVFEVTDGKDGVDGQDGKDYVLTEADKTEIAQQAAALIDTSLAAAIGSGVIV